MTGKVKKSENGLTQSSINQRLLEIRKQIDALDSQLLTLLNERAGLCRDVGGIKSQSNECVFKPFREKEVLGRLIAENPGLLPEEHLRAIYREILSSSRRLQRPQQVVYLGPEGTFSYFAGLETLGHSADFSPCHTIKDVFRKVANKEAELGIIPFENSLQGSVGQSLDMFMTYDVFIQAEVFCKISHALLSRESALDAVETVYSNPQALMQCADWLRSHLPSVKLVPLESTAAAAEKVVTEPGSAAIGHEQLGDMLNLQVLQQNIEDLPDNWTRFLIIGATAPNGGHQDKTSLIFTLPDESGALVSVLTILAREGINMKKLESRPVRTEKWGYLFFADLECDLSGEMYVALKKELAAACHHVRILGSYPAGRYLYGDA